MTRPPLPTILSGNCGYGELTLGGGLGHDSEIASHRIVGPPGTPFDEVLSAHAHSDVMIELHEPALVQGFIAASTGGDPCNPVLFTIDFNAIGLAGQPLDLTGEIALAPGPRRLRCLSRHAPHGLHSAWGFRRAPQPPPPPLAVLTVGRYPLAELDWKLREFTRSLTRFGHLARVCDAGEPMGSWTLCKTAAALEAVRSLPGHITHVLFCDGGDCAVLGCGHELIKRFDSLGVEFALSMERACWPVENDPEWSGCFPAVPGGEALPQRGDVDGRPGGCGGGAGGMHGDV